MVNRIASGDGVLRNQEVMEATVQPLTFRCPRTGREFGSGIHAQPDALMRLFSLRLRCPACEDLHEWHASEGVLRAHKVRAVCPLESRLLRTGGTPHEVLHDVGMSYGEIAAYFVRFRDVWIDLFEYRREGSERKLRLSEDAEHAELV
jgi:hypothetical protein